LLILYGTGERNGSYCVEPVNVMFRVIWHRRIKLYLLSGTCEY